MSLEKLFRKAEGAYRDGKPAEALKHLKKLDRDAPGHPEVAHLKGVCLFDLKRYGEAEQALSVAARAKPGDPGLMTALATTYRHLGDLDRAESLFQAAITTGRADWAVFNNYANLLKAMGRPAEAVATYRHAIALNPTAASPWENMAGALRSVEGRDAAVDALRRACELAPGNADLWARLGHEGFTAGAYGVAREALAKALSLAPDNSSALLSAGLLDIHLGASEAGSAKVRAAAAGTLSPDELGSAILALNYDETAGNADIRRLAATWDKRFGRPKPLVSRKRATPPDAPLRVGIMAGYFGQHPVSQFVTSWLPWAETAGMEIVVFHTQPVTEADRAAWAGAAEWVDLGMADGPAAACMAAAGLDVAISAAGHGDNSRVEVLAHRVAPLQVLAFGYFCTTGIGAVDVVMADPRQIPEGSEDGFTERVLRLPNDYLCYRPPAYLPDIAAPDPTAGPVLGSFNNPSKYGPSTAALWAAVMDAIPSARLLLKAPQFRDASAVANVRKLFADAGIAPERIDIEPPAPHADLLAAYNRVDIALDPVGYSGGLTTLEALWMGVPVVTLPGERFCARHSLSHLENAGLGRFVARDVAHYVASVQDWLDDAADPLTRRRAVWDAVAGSPIGDGERYARDLAAALKGCLAAF